MKINALVVDDSKEFISSVVKYFQNNSIVNIKKTLTNENEVVPYLEENKDFIDLIIINLEMNNQDNIWLLNELDKRNIKKHLIAISNYKKNCGFNLANLRNVDYYMLKPINLDYLNNNFVKINNKLNLGKIGTHNRFRSHMLRKFHASSLYNCENSLTVDEIDALQGRKKDATHKSYFMENPINLKNKYIKALNSVTFY